MAYSTGWEDPHEAEPARGGVVGLINTALWTAAGLGAVVLVVMGAYSLGVRDTGSVVALGGEGWRERPAEAGGAPTPGADSAAFDPLGPAAADPTVGLAPAAETERPTPEDAAAAEERIALSSGDPISDAAFIELISDAVDNPEAAQRRRVIELEPATPREGEVAEFGPEREDLPPNVGEGSLPEPPQTTAYLTEDDAGQPPIDAPLEADAPPLAWDDGSLEAAGIPSIESVEAAAQGDSRTETATPSTPTEVSLAPASASPPAAAPPAAPAPAATPTAQDGGFQIQFAALNSVEAVERRFEEIRAQHADLVGDMQLDIQPFNIGTLRMYRFRMGAFSTREEASRLCARFSERGVDCFPTER